MTKYCLVTSIILAFFFFTSPRIVSAEIIDAYVASGYASSTYTYYYDAYPGNNPPCPASGGSIFAPYGALDNAGALDVSTIYTTITLHFTNPGPTTTSNFVDCFGAWGSTPNSTHNSPDHVNGKLMQVDLSAPPTGTQCLEATVNSYFGEYYTSVGGACSTAVFTYFSAWVAQNAVLFKVGTPVGNIGGFTAVERNVYTEANPGFNLNWADASGETGYRVVWRNATLGKSGTVTLPANTTSVMLLEDSAVPIASRNYVCDGSTYEFELEAYNPDQVKRSPKILGFCSRAYNDPGVGSMFSVNSTSLTASIDSAIPVASRDSASVTSITIPVNINNPNPPQPVEATVRLTTTVSYAGTTTMPPAINESIEMYQITTPISGNQNVTLDVVWPGVRETGESMSVTFKVELLDSRQDVASSAVTTTPITYSGTYIPPGVPTVLNDGLVTAPTNLRSKTQIGIISGLNSMSEKREVFAGKEYDLKVTLSGTTSPAPVAAGTNVIMLSLDTTGSMASMMSTSTGNRRRFDIAKDALKRFIDMSRDSEYIGLTVFSSCDALWRVGTGANEFDTPVWSYEGHNPQLGRRTGHALILNDFVPVSSSRALLKSQIDKMSMNSGNGVVTVCPKMAPLATNLGGGITASLASFLGNSYTGPTYTNSGNFSDGIIRPMRGPVSIPGAKPFVVLATDGEENQFPKSNQADINGQPSPVDTAINNNIPIYTISMGQGSYATNLQSISTRTRGKFAPGDSGDAIIEAFEAIRDEIDNQSAVSTVTYRLNMTSFRYGNLASMVITTRKLGESVETPLGTGCPSVVCTISGDTITISSPYFTPSDRVYLYLKATPVLINPLALRERDILVNDNISKVEFIGDNYLIENTTVDIIPQLPYFTVRGGNIYSKNSIVSILPEREEYFAKENEPIIFLGSGVAEFGMGDSAPQKRLLNGYNVTTNFSGSFYNYYMKLTESHSSATVEDDDVLSQITNDLKIVKYRPPSINPFRPLTFDNPTPINKDAVIFVDGDLYVTNNILVQQGNLATFMVNGNIYVHESVENIEGIFASDQRIYTHCTAVNNCPKQLLAGNTLTLSGMFYAMDGLFLGRRGDPMNNNPRPGEQFVMRPDLLLKSNQLLGSRSANFFEVNE